MGWFWGCGSAGNRNGAGGWVDKEGIVARQHSAHMSWSCLVRYLSCFSTYSLFGCHRRRKSYSWKWLSVPISRLKYKA